MRYALPAALYFPAASLEIVDLESPKLTQLEQQLIFSTYRSLLRCSEHVHAWGKLRRVASKVIRKKRSYHFMIYK